MGRRVRLIVLSAVFAFAVFLALWYLVPYISMVRDTDPVIKEFKDIVCERIAYSDDPDDQLMQRYYPEGPQKGAVVSVKIRRTYVEHDYHHGFMTCRYSLTGRDPDTGELIYGSLNIPTTWEIQKTDGVWKVIDIRENP